MPGGAAGTGCAQMPGGPAGIMRAGTVCWNGLHTMEDVGTCWKEAIWTDAVGTCVPEKATGAAGNGLTIMEDVGACWREVVCPDAVGTCVPEEATGGAGNGLTTMEDVGACWREALWNGLAMGACLLNSAFSLTSSAAADEVAGMVFNFRKVRVMAPCGSSTSMNVFLITRFAANGQLRAASPAAVLLLIPTPAIEAPGTNVVVGAMNVDCNGLDGARIESVGLRDSNEGCADPGDICTDAAGERIENWGDPPAKDCVSPRNNTAGVAGVAGQTCDGRAHVDNGEVSAAGDCGMSATVTGRAGDVFRRR